MTEDKITISWYKKEGEVEYFKAIRFPAQPFIDALKREKKNVLDKREWEKQMAHIKTLPYEKLKMGRYENVGY